ncbi:MAG: hypothetical protein IPO19_18135 [Rhodoferax sp.]|nr:hypothetical protein [Rhodoferax sp.]MBK9237786.1 hypothetical protein [Rhodoferax sp.]
MKLTSKSLIAAAALLACAATLAQTKAPEPDYTLAYNVGATTDYRYRGISQTRLKPTLQGGVDFSHKSGLYLGAWGSGIKWIKDGGGDANIELDLYGGYKGSAGSVSYDLGVLTYQYPSNKLNPSANTTELYVAGTMGPATLKYSHSVTNLFGFANSKSSGYLDLSASFDLGNGWSVAPHVGRQRVANNSIFSYTDYSLTVNKDIDGLILSAALVGTNAEEAAYTTSAAAGSKFLGKNGLLVSIKKNF